MDNQIELIDAGAFDSLVALERMYYFCNELFYFLF